MCNVNTLHVHVFVLIYMNRISFVGLLLFIMLIIYGCGNNEKESRVLYLSMKDKRTCFPEDLFELFEVVPLETNDSILLGDISVIEKILKKDNRIYMSDWRYIYVFDDKGKHIQTMKHIGQGPECYLGVSSFVIWENGDIYIWDRTAIYKYSKDDAFLGKVPISYDELAALNVKDMMCLNDSLLLLRSDESQGIPFKMHAMKRKSGEVIHHYFLQHDRIITCWAYPNYSYHEDNLYLNMRQDNNIYRLTADSAYIHYTINVENRMPPKGFWDNMQMSDIQLVSTAIREGYVSHIPFFMETENHILLKFEDKSDGNIRYYTFIDKHTRKNYLIEHLRMEDLDYIPEYMYPIKDGEAYFLIPADIICEKGEKFRQKYCPELKDDDNPVLCRVKIR